MDSDLPRDSFYLMSLLICGSITSAISWIELEPVRPLAFF
jgi:hypothetical protein